MPDKAHDSTNSGAAGLLTRRGVLGLGAASLLAAGTRQLAAARASAGSDHIANQGSVVEFSTTDTGSTVLSSFRNAATRFEWAAVPKSFAPPLEYPGNVIPWQPLPAKASHDHMTLRAKSGALEGLLEIVAYAETGAFRWQTSFLNTGSKPIHDVTRLNALDLDLRSDIGRLVVHCVRRDGDYTREALPFRSRLEILGGDWNAPAYTGLIVIEAVGRSEYLVLGVQQERGWRFALEQSDGGLRLSVTLSGMQKTLSPHGTLSACPIFIGASGGDLDTAVNLALQHLRARILPAPLPGAPWVSYDIWSTDATDVEKNILDEARFAAAMGVELFYLDAAWYQGSSTRGTGDWGKGLGSYLEDRSKFPRGLRYLSDQVHAAGMKFGLWVGPNIVDATLVPSQIPAAWLATVDDQRAELKIPAWENACLQVCLGSTGYAAHLKQALAKLVEDYNLDWIKWDNSGIPALPARCNRSDHGHNRDDGSSAALDNQYAIFEHLHQRFPNLVLEQCGYGSRLDYGLARTIRANWCSDTCYPASRLRSNSMVCATVYPAAYNAGWIVSEDTELFGAKTQAGVDAAIRSRMLGLFGVGTLNGQMSQRASLYPKNILERFAVNLGLYKQFRHLLFQQVSFPYRPYGTDSQGWQAIQFTATNGSEAVLLCFRAASTQTTSELPLSRLQPSSSYRVRFIDARKESRMDGESLMKDGLYLSLPEAGSSEIILIDEM